MQNSQIEFNSVFYGKLFGGVTTSERKMFPEIENERRGGW